MKGNNIQKISHFRLVTIVALFVFSATLCIFAGTAAAVALDEDIFIGIPVPTLDTGKFYTVSPSGSSAGLWSIDPFSGATNLVTYLNVPEEGSEGFMTNAIAFNPGNALYAWDTSRRQLYTIDYSTGQINYIGTPGSNSTPRWINGLAFDRGGHLYGMNGPTNELYSIDTVSGAVSSIGNTGKQINHNGLAIDFMTDKLYALTGCKNGWGCQSDILYELDKSTGQAIAEYGLPFLDQGQVGVEFHSGTGELYSLRNGNRLMAIDMLGGTEIEKFLLEGIGSTNLAAPYAPVPEPGTLAMLASGLVATGFLSRRKMFRS